MFPRLIEFPPVTIPGFLGVGPFTIDHIPSYGVMLTVAFFVGLWLIVRQAEREGFDRAVVMDLGIYLLLVALVGAKLLLVLVNLRYYLETPGELWGTLRSAGVYYGGMLAAVAFFFWYTGRHGLDRWKLVDVLALVQPLQQAIGRVGCLAAGCCYGAPTDRSWGIAFTDPLAADTTGVPLNVPLHPTQAYLTLMNLALFGLLILVARGKRWDGQVFWTWIFWYAVGRFVVEFFRDDYRGYVFREDLATSQFLCLILAPIALGVLIGKSRRLREAEAPPGEEPAAAVSEAGLPEAPAEEGERA